MTGIQAYRISGKQPRKRIQSRRIASYMELAEWTGRSRQWISRKAREYVLMGNELNLRILTHVLDFSRFLERENERGS